MGVVVLLLACAPEDRSEGAGARRPQPARWSGAQASGRASPEEQRSDNQRRPRRLPCRPHAAPAAPAPAARRRGPPLLTWPSGRGSGGSGEAAPGGGGARDKASTGGRAGRPWGDVMDTRRRQRRRRPSHLLSAPAPPGEREANEEREGGREGGAELLQ